MKAEERLRRYGKKAYAKMRGFRGKKALKEVERLKTYKEVPLEIKPKAPYISRSQRSYWRDVKSLSKERKIGIKESRRILKKEKTGRNVQVRVIKSGNGWQLVMKGLYIRTKKDGESLKPPYEEVEQTGYSTVFEEQDYEEAFEECQKEALNNLGGAMFGDGYGNIIEDSDWKLKKVLKETWVRYFGREV